VIVTDHLAFVRSQGCIVRGKGDRCLGPVQAHHVRTAANSGMGMKPPHSEVVGLCFGHHREHDRGKRTFAAKYNVDLAAEARRLAALDTQQETPTMNDNAPRHCHDNGTTLSDPAIEALRERVGQYDADIAEHARAISIATGCRESLLDVIATLSRKPRTRSKPRIAAPVPPGTLEGALASLGATVAANDAQAPAEADAA